jgi:peptide-methionine (R)-S-oxide reductase
MSLFADEEPLVVKSDDEWRMQLSVSEFAVLRRGRTERPWSGQYVETRTPGVYCCRACDAELFRSRTKLDSASGWATFSAPISAENVVLRPDRNARMTRVEVRCAGCHGFLGLFAYDGLAGDEYRINSLALQLRPLDD